MEEVGTIDLTPTWGEWANMYRSFAESGETEAIRRLGQDFARAMVGAEALRVLTNTLTEEQAKIASETIVAELSKQGF